jgi:predicted PurR-regulated permease PerM
LVLAPFLAYYLLRDWEIIRRSALSLIPINSHAEALSLFGRLHRLGSGFIRGQLIVSGFVALLITFGLATLGVKYALLIGLLGGIFDIIPYFGPLIGGAPAVLLGLTRSPATAVWAALWIFLVHQIEGTILQPRIMGEHVGLHPLTVIFAILAGSMGTFWAQS